MKMRVGICQWGIPVKAAEKSIACAAAVSLLGVELDLGRHEEHFPLSHKTEQEKYQVWRAQFRTT